MAEKRERLKRLSLWPMTPEEAIHKALQAPPLPIDDVLSHKSNGRPKKANRAKKRRVGKNKS